jgi:hypothetical protein
VWFPRPSFGRDSGLRSHGTSYRKWDKSWTWAAADGLTFCLSPRLRELPQIQVEKEEEEDTEEEDEEEEEEEEEEPPK